jgi:hypothetical protein
MNLGSARFARKRPSAGFTAGRWRNPIGGPTAAASVGGYPSATLFRTASVAGWTAVLRGAEWRPPVVAPPAVPDENAADRAKRLDALSTALRAPRSRRRATRWWRRSGGCGCNRVTPRWTRRCGSSSCSWAACRRWPCPSSMTSWPADQTGPRAGTSALRALRHRRIRPLGCRLRPGAGLGAPALRCARRHRPHPHPDG